MYFATFPLLKNHTFQGLDNRPSSSGGKNIVPGLDLEDLEGFAFAPAPQVGA